MFCSISIVTHTHLNAGAQKNTVFGPENYNNKRKNEKSVSVLCCIIIICKTKIITSVICDLLCKH